MLMHIARIVGVAFGLVVGGTVLLRLSGKKSLSELTVASTVVLFMLGEILSAPMLSDSSWETLLTMATCLATLRLLEFLQVKFPWLRHMLLGRALSIIEDGRYVDEHFRKLSMTKQDVQMQLEEKGLDMKDVKSVTMATNGKLTYELWPGARPATMRDLKTMLEQLASRLDPNRGSPYDAQEELEEPTTFLFKLDMERHGEDSSSSRNSP